MLKHFSYLIATLLAANACVQNPKQNSNPGTKETAPNSTGPDDNDLLDVLQGRWQSEQDAAYIIEINDGILKRINGSQTSEEAVIEVFSTCKNAACQADSLAASGGWCFVENGKNGAVCNLVIHCDSLALRFRPLGVANATFSFKKI